MLTEDTRRCQQSIDAKEELQEHDNPNFGVHGEYCSSESEIIAVHEWMLPALELENDGDKSRQKGCQTLVRLALCRLASLMRVSAITMFPSESSTEARAVVRRNLLQLQLHYLSPSPRHGQFTKNTSKPSTLHFCVSASVQGRQRHRAGVREGAFVGPSLPCGPLTLPPTQRMVSQIHAWKDPHKLCLAL